MTAYLSVLLAGSVFLLPEICQAQDGPASSIGLDDDCSDVSVVFRNGSDLTRQERIALMDKALMHSLSKYERCQLSSSSSGGGGSAGGSSGDSAGNGQQASSTASSEMSGTQTPDESTDSGNASAANSKAAKEANPEASQTHAASPSPRKQTRGSGQAPKDIPPVDNDSVLEEQIRQAAMNETDPVIKARLWNEYRKYKGLPVLTKPKR